MNTSDVNVDYNGKKYEGSTGKEYNFLGYNSESESMLTIQKLKRRLSRIKALEEGSSSYGERIAAKNAKERIQRRLGQSFDTDVPENDPPKFVEDEIFRSQIAPTRTEIIAKLQAWQDGTLCQKELVRWSRNVVDKVTFDVISPEHPDSIPIELIMICSAMDRRIWSKADIAALMEFALSPNEPLEAWKRWFAHVGHHF